jgi:hypothetical protein
VKHHVDFFRHRLVAPIGNAKLGKDRLSTWANTHSASLAPPTVPGYPITLNSLIDLDTHFAGEGAKFASVAFESLETFRTRWATAEDRDGIAWRFVGLYYSAFYAAHAVLRLLGRSLTNVPAWSGVQAEFDALHKSTSIPNLELRTGYHLMTLSPDKRSIEIRNANASASKGSHGVTWDEFRDLADDVYANNSLNTTHQQRAAADYAGIIAQPVCIDHESSSIQWPWMSAMRNKINYRIPENLWGPPNKRVTPSRMAIIHRLVYEPTPDRIVRCASDQEPLVRFVASCTYILSILASLCGEMEQRASSRPLLPRFVSDRSDLLKSFN